MNSDENTSAIDIICTLFALCEFLLENFFCLKNIEKVCIKLTLYNICPYSINAEEN